MADQALTKAEKQRYPGDPSFITFRHEEFDLGLRRNVKGVKWTPILQQQTFSRRLKFAIDQALTKAEKQRYPGGPSFITFRHEEFDLGLRRNVKGVKWTPILQQQTFSRRLKFAIEEVAEVVSEAPSYAP